STVLGIGVAYVVITVCYITGLALTFGVARGRPMPDPSAPPRGAAHDLKDGLVHVVTTPTLLAVMLLAFLINLSAYPITSGLLPYVARRIYLVDATGLGWLVASFSLGALLGSIAVVVSGGPRRPSRSMLVCAAPWYALLLGFGHGRSLGPGLAVPLVAGVGPGVALGPPVATGGGADRPAVRARVRGAR